MNHPHVHKRAARERVDPAPESGVRLVEEDGAPMERGWRGLRGAVEQEFRGFGARVWRDDEMSTARDEWRCE